MGWVLLTNTTRIQPLKRPHAHFLTHQSATYRFRRPKIVILSAADGRFLWCYYPFCTACFLHVIRCWINENTLVKINRYCIMTWLLLKSPVDSGFKLHRPGVVLAAWKCFKCQAAQWYNYNHCTVVNSQWWRCCSSIWTRPAKDSWFLSPGTHLANYSTLNVHICLLPFRFLKINSNCPSLWIQVQ